MFCFILVDQEGSAMLYLDKYKVVILNEPRKPSIGERITSSASPGKAMKTWLDWKPREDISVTVNLIEILEQVGFLVMLKCVIYTEYA